MYSYLQTIKKSLVKIGILCLGWIIAGFLKDYPELANIYLPGLGMTFSFVLLCVYDWLKHKAGFRLP